MQGLELHQPHSGYEPDKPLRLLLAMRIVGLEPTLHFYNQILNLTCLPIPPYAQNCLDEDFHDMISPKLNTASCPTQTITNDKGLEPLISDLESDVLPINTNHPCSKFLFL